jgi:hypothetical protein
MAGVLLEGGLVNLYKEREVGEDAQRVLNSEAYQGAWQAYEARILEELVAAPSDAVDRILHYKRLLSVSKAVRGHLERLVNEGAVAIHEINLDEKRKSWLRRA